MTVDEIFSKFGTATALGAAIGRNPIRAAEYRQRGSIPVRYWSALIEGAKSRDIKGITYEALLEAHAAKEKAA